MGPRGVVAPWQTAPWSVTRANMSSAVPCPAGRFSRAAIRAILARYKGILERADRDRGISVRGREASGRWPEGWAGVRRVHVGLCSAGPE